MRSTTRSSPRSPSPAACFPSRPRPGSSRSGRCSPGWLTDSGTGRTPPCSIGSSECWSGTAARYCCARSTVGRTCPSPFWPASRSRSSAASPCWRPAATGRNSSPPESAAGYDAGRRCVWEDGRVVAESSSPSIPALPGLAVETVEWLPSGAESGLVRVRGRWTDEGARQPDLPVLALRAAGAEHRFDSLPDARFSRDPASWRGTYLVPAALVASDPDALWLEWAGGTRAGLPALSRGVEPPPVPGAARPEPEVEDSGGEVIDRAVLAERRARRAKAAEKQQARVAAEALKAVEVLELRSTELERRLEEATAERDALLARESEADERRGALTAALASAAELRSRSRDWQLRLRTNEVTRAGDAVRLAVLEAEKATTAPALRAALDEAQAEAVSARAALGEADGRFGEARAAWDRRRAELEAELTSVRAALEEARGLESVVADAEGRAAAAEARLQVETVARTTLEDELDRERAARAADRTGEELRAARAEADRLRADLATTRANAAASHATADTLAADLEAARSDAASARATADALTGDLEAARSDAASARASAVALSGDLEAARSDAASARASAVALSGDLEAARS